MRLTFKQMDKIAQRAGIEPVFDTEKRLWYIGDYCHTSEQLYYAMIEKLITPTLVAAIDPDFEVKA